jgi:hypothetical protein
LRIVGLVDGASLAEILYDDKSRLALANSIDKYLIGSACINTFTPLCNGIIGISVRAFSTFSINKIVVGNAVTVEGIDIEYLIFTALIAMVIRTGGNLSCRFTVITVLRVGCYGK